MFQATPDFKGIKTKSSSLATHSFMGFRPPLISKGLRLRGAGKPGRNSGFRPPLISKGLRQIHRSAFAYARWFQATPDFKGIKTRQPRALFAPAMRFQATPDFKGIKTECAAVICQLIAVSGHP